MSSQSSQTVCVKCRFEFYSDDDTECALKWNGRCRGCHSRILHGWETIPDFYRKKAKSNESTSLEFSDEKPFLTIIGPPGSGKSISAATWILVNLRKNHEVPLWINSAELMLKIRSSFKDESLTEESVIKKYSDAELLVIDDLASEKVSDYSTSTLYLIINRRGEQNKKTIITGNFKDVNNIMQELGDRIANRIVRYGKVVVMK
jgi:DNA replication protein DnaC